MLTVMGVIEKPEDMRELLESVRHPFFKTPVL